MPAAACRPQSVDDLSDVVSMTTTAPPVSSET
jgi:hypothetical protein